MIIIIMQIVPHLVISRLTKPLKLRLGAFSRINAAEPEFASVMAVIGRRGA
jgi:hypothetical protein